MANTHRWSRRKFLGTLGAAAVGGHLAAGCTRTQAAEGDAAAAPGVRPNILFCIADDWGWPHARVFGDPVVQTPTFDRVCRDGVLLTQTYVSSPSCTPSRGAILTGQAFYRLEQGSNLWSTLPAKFPVYTDLLAAAGYHVGCTRKGWGPGNVKAGGREENAAGKAYKDFAAFLEGKPDGQPFCFWFGSHDPHRSYEAGSGVAGGMKPGDVRVLPIWPDTPEVRSDLCDYYFEVQRYDREVGELVALLDAKGMLQNTLVVMTGDNGCPFPRAKTNLYDVGVRIPTAAMWPARVKGGRVVEDFVSFTDFAPTFVEAAGLAPPPDMTGRSLLGVLTGGQAGRVDAKRDRVVTGRERHTNRREGARGYPMRALRTHDWLYIRNFAPDRWPAGDPPGYGDIDGGPTKTCMMEHREDGAVAPLFALAFEKRPAEELYDCRADPWQMKNLADDPAHADVKKRMAADLMAALTETKDPRVLGQGDVFDAYPYYSGGGAAKKKPAAKE